MQRKNDDLKSKLELYESAGILDESVEFIFNGVSARLVEIEFIASIKMCLPGLYHRDYSAISATSLTSMILKTVPHRYGTSFSTLFHFSALFIATIIFFQASSTIVEEEKSHTKKHSKRGLVGLDLFFINVFSIQGTKSSS